MLWLSRKKGEQIVIGDFNNPDTFIHIRIDRFKDDRVKMGVNTSSNFWTMRKELLDKLGSPLPRISVVPEL